MGTIEHSRSKSLYKKILTDYVFFCLCNLYICSDLENFLILFRIFIYRDRFMASIAVENIGPLKQTGQIDLKMVNLFIGKQSTGKSTLMKILCYCRWVEKKIMTGNDSVLSAYTHNNKFLKELMLFYRFNESAFSENSCVIYQGDCVTIYWDGTRNNARIERLDHFEKERYNTKLCFIPSERNLLSAIRNLDRSYRTSDLDVLFNYILEWDETRDMYTRTEPKTLTVAPVMEYYFDREKNTDMIRLKATGKEFSTFYASSGIQSALPVEVLVDYICGMAGKSAPVTKDELYDLLKKFLQRTPAENDSAVSAEKMNDLPYHLINYQSVQLYIEELEQNLYPESQWELVRHIVSSIKKATETTAFNSMLTLTTHSPYVLTALNVLMLASRAFQKNQQATLNIIPPKYILPKNSYGAYYLTEQGDLENILDSDLGMISGMQLDGVSDRVDECIAELNAIIYGGEKLT